MALSVVAWAAFNALGAQGAEDSDPVSGAGQPVLLLRPDPVPVAPGGVWMATLFVLNPSAQPIVARLPSRLAWREIAGTGSASGAAARARGEWTRRGGGGEGALGEISLAPGGFARADLETVLPSVWEAGEAHSIEVPMLEGVRFIVSVAGSIDDRRPSLANEEPGGSGFREATGAMPDLSPIGPRELPGQGFFRRHFAGYEPVYFVWGPEEPNAKFQVSFRYRVLNPDAELGRWWEWARGLNVAYTQTSLWDLNTPSAPFYDTSYKPEFLWREDDLFPGAVTWWRQLGLQAGVQHESNGKEGADSRGLNILYLRPTFVWGEVTNLFVAASPRFWIYAGDLSGNPAIKDYRGNMDLTLKAGWARGLQAAGLFRVGDGFDRGSMQIDVTYPTLRLLGNVDLLLHAQYFNGWGESLLAYDERTWLFRFGVSLYR